MAINKGVNSPIAKKLWNILRVTFIMLRKGLISKRKLIMDMNLMMKRGKILRKSFTNLINSHNRNVTRGRRFGGIQDYEFSCRNSPNPIFFHVPTTSKRKHNYFPCINLPAVIEELSEEDKSVALLPKTPKYTFNYESEFTHGTSLSPFHVRVSNYSSEDESDEVCGIENDRRVDDEAEEFIKRFYEQLKVQRSMQLLQYQEMEY